MIKKAYVFLVSVASVFGVALLAHAEPLMVGNIGSTASQGGQPASAVTTVTSPVATSLQTLPGRERVAQGKSLKFTYTYKNNTAKTQTVTVRRTLETAAGKVLQTFVGQRVVGGGKEFAMTTSTYIGWNMAPGQYNMRIKMFNAGLKNSPLITEQAFTFAVTAK